MIFRLIGPNDHLPKIFGGRRGLLNDLDFSLGRNYLRQKSFHKFLFSKQVHTKIKYLILDANLKC